MALSAFKWRLTLTVMLVLSLILILATTVLIPTGKHALAATQETVIAPFTNGPNGVTTTNSFAGKVAITVSGIGQAAGPRYSDAFYVFTDDAGNLIPPEHHWDFGLCINNQTVDNYVATPLYRSDHTYQFTISLSGPPQPITFGVCDQYTADNSGRYTITVTGASAQPQPLVLHADSNLLTNITEVTVDASLSTLGPNLARVNYIYFTADEPGFRCAGFAQPDITIISQGKVVFQQVAPNKPPILLFGTGLRAAQKSEYLFLYNLPTVIVARGNAHIVVGYITEYVSILSTNPDGSINACGDPQDETGSLQVNIP